MHQVASYEVKVSNFSSSFKDGLAFCALLHKFRPSVVPWDELKAANDPHRALNTAFEVARDHLGVEPLMDAEDVADVRRPGVAGCQRCVHALVAAHTE